MFDNLMDDSSSGAFSEDHPGLGTGRPDDISTRPARRFLGMTAPQRFVISLMLLLAVCSLGAMCLLITGRIGL